MWGRIKLKVTRSRDSAPTTTYDEHQEPIDDEMTLTDSNKLSFGNSSDAVYHSHQRSGNADLEQIVANEICPSSMGHRFSNHSFSSLTNHMLINGTYFANNRACSDTDMLHRFQNSNSEPHESVNSDGGFPLNENKIRQDDSKRYSHLENCNGYAIDKGCNVESGSRQVVGEMSNSFSSESYQRVCSSPPKLMRREKVKSGEIAELRKTRLSCHLTNRGSTTTVPKPLELPSRQKSTNCTAAPDVMQTSETAFGTHGTAVVKKSKLMSSSSSASNCQMLTEPSTAESIDSGIQPSLSSANEDKVLNSSGAEDDPRDDPFSDCFSSQNSDYMLLEDAKAMMATSLPSGSGCADYIDHFVVERFPPHGMTTSQQVPMNYVPYCESVTVLRRVNYNPGDEKVQQSFCNYEPVDRSFASSYNDDTFEVRQNETKTFVTRGTETDDAEFSSKHERSLSAGMECGHGNRTVNSHVLSPAVGLGTDIDSDDDSYLPPLPSRNYRKISEKDTDELPVLSDMMSSHVSLETDSEEKTHMSWEEVMKEAHALGIPLSAPRSEVSSVSVASSDTSDFVDNPTPYTCNDLDRMSSSEHIAVGSNSLQDNISDASQNVNSPSKVSALAKCASPFKEKFKLHNLFSKKKNKKTTDSDCEVRDSNRVIQRHASAAAEIQRRNLPPLPPKRYQARSSNMSRSSLDPIPPSSEFQRQRAHRTLSTLTLPARDSSSEAMTGSMWASSSASVGGHSQTSETGICSRSVSGMESHRDMLTHSKLMSFFLCII